MSPLSLDEQAAMVRSLQPVIGTAAAIGVLRDHNPSLDVVGAVVLLAGTQRIADDFMPGRDQDGRWTL